MTNRNPEFDSYIAKSKEFAQPILNYLREIVHEAIPDAKEEIKWGMMHFTKKAIICNIAAFNEHCALGFWHEVKMKEYIDLEKVSNEKAMGSMGKIKSIKDLPKKSLLIKYLKLANKLDEAEIKIQRKAKIESKELILPNIFLENLKKNQVAMQFFESLSTAQKREYLDWFQEAKTEGTRNKRIAQGLDWMSENKIRNWKYTKSK